MKLLLQCLVILDTSNEGTTFVVALSPAFDENHDAELIINARHTTSVTISSKSTSEVVTVCGNWSLYYDLDYSIRATSGVEEKGMSIKSEEPITVHLAALTETYTQYNQRSPDSVLLRPLSEYSVEYFLAGHDGDYSSTYSWPLSFYMVVASEDNTEVEVVYADNGIDLEDEHFTLKQFEVFTKDSRNMTDPQLVDFTGTRIVATKPVSVFSGDGVALLPAPGGSGLTHYIYDSMPSTEELETEYTTFPIHFGGDGGYEVRIIAVHNDTNVTVPAFSTSLTLNTGQFHVVDNSETSLGFRISCSKPCMSVQYMKNLPPGGVDSHMMSMFMAVLVPDELFSESLVFTVPRMIESLSLMKAAISVIVDSYPVTGLYLNDTSLADLNWRRVQESSNWFATVEIETGFHILHSVEGLERFTAYLYGLRSDRGYPAIGFPVGYGGESMSQMEESNRSSL